MIRTVLALLYYLFEFLSANLYSSGWYSTLELFAVASIDVLIQMFLISEERKINDSLYFQKDFVISHFSPSSIFLENILLWGRVYTEVMFFLMCSFLCHLSSSNTGKLVWSFNICLFFLILFQFLFFCSKIFLAHCMLY